MKGMRAFTQKEIEKIIDHNMGSYVKRNKALILLGIGTGLRISELLSLRMKDVFMQNGKVYGEIYIEKKNTKKKTSGASIKLHFQVKKALSEYFYSLKSFSMTDPLFKSRKGNNSITRVQADRIIKELLYVAGEGSPKRIATHSMRKTFAQNADKEFNGDIFFIQKALRHKSLDNTVAYIAREEKEIQDRMAKVKIY